MFDTFLAALFVGLLVGVNILNFFQPQAAGSFGNQDQLMDHHEEQDLEV